MVSVTHRQVQPDRAASPRLGQQREQAGCVAFPSRAVAVGRERKADRSTMPNGDPPPVMLWGDEGS